MAVSPRGAPCLSQVSRRRYRTLSVYALSAGGGGASGSVTLENLMEKMSFGHKPKIADLTSARRLADKVAPPPPPFA